MTQSLDASVMTACARARDHLLGLQHPNGWWKGELETNVTMDAEDLLLRHFLGVSTPDVVEETATWIRSQQRSDGTWAIYYEGPGELSTTVEAYTALRLAGDAVDSDHMVKAAEFVRDAGGLERARVFTRLWLALVGQWSWDDLPVIPPELVLLPAWAPVSIYDFGCWARQTVVALTVVSSYRPVRPLPFDLDELRTHAPPSPRASLREPEGRWQELDRWLHRYQRTPLRPLRRAALAEAERWIVARQEADGCWGGIQPAWVYSLLALHLRGYPFDHPVMRSGLKGLDSFTIRDERGRRLEACQSPVWDTALAVIALVDAGLDPTDPALVGAADWLLDEEVRVRGDWSVRRPDLDPGGWAFEFANVNYPDVDDTAEVALALRLVGHPDPGRVDAALARGVTWVRGMRCRDGAWGAFDADNTATWPANLPFCDFGAVVDPPTADVTAHVVEMLAECGAVGDDGTVPAAIEWLRRAQEPDGSWWGRWGANHIYGTGAVLPALVSAGMARDAPEIRRAVSWLVDHQNADGGWGEDPRSYREADWVARGASTASQTAWALLAMIAAGEHDHPATARALRWLVEHQRPDGTWDEPWFTGTGFPGDFSINYHLYRLTYPLMALGRYLRCRADESGAAHRAGGTR